MTLLSLLSRDLEALVARVSPAVVGVAHGRGRGSGFVLAPDGFVVTNAHVVQGAKEVRVELAGEDLAAKVVGVDATTDVAVLKADATDLVALPLADRAHVRVGQIVVAIGNPLRFDRSVSLGVVSATDRALPARRGRPLEGLIQTDAAINPGNSGGPLVDAEGEVVGISTAIVPWAQGLGFAVPAHTAGWVASVLMRHGEVRRPVLGVHARSVDLDARKTGRSRALHIVEVG
ncbi:MAG: S1C family serine protease, partial [Myxococcota bacterium]